MSLYQIKNEVPLCEYDKLFKFIKYSWKENHAFVKSRELLDFQHLDKEREVYHFIVAENQETGEFDALVGYIPLSQFDKSLEENGDYWGAIWKRRDDIVNDEIKGMGFFVWDRLFRLPNFKSHGAISMSNDARMMYKARRLPIDIMNQYYILNEDIKEFHIAGNIVNQSIVKPTFDKETCELRWVDLNEIKDDEVKPIYRPFKSLQFFINRYKKHPIYHYGFLGLFKGCELKAILAVREISVNNSKVLRIVDVLGDLQGNIYKSSQKLMNDNGYEYIDILNYGIDEFLFSTMGFSKLNLDSETPIIPNYFEPFVQDNVKFEISYKAKFPYIAFKGDADQDRPNIL